jgi:hypothetical protein
MAGAKTGIAPHARTASRTLLAADTGIDLIKETLT